MAGLERQGLPETGAAWRIASEPGVGAAPARPAGEIDHAGQIQELKESNWRLRTLVELAPYAIMMMDKDGVVQVWNPMAEQVFGWSEQEALGRLPRTVPGDRMERFQEAQRKVFSGQPIIDELVTVTQKDGSLLHMRMSKIPIKDDSGQVVAAYTILRDETERQRVWTELVQEHTRMEDRVRERTSELEASNHALRQEIVKRTQVEQSLLKYQSQLKSLASELRTTEERQRRRIASDLHDGVGQALALAQAKLVELTSCPKSEANRKTLGEVLDLVKQAIAGSRSLAYDLSPPILYDLGLEPALDWLAEKLGREYPLVVHFQQSGPAVALDADVRATLFRAVWELLNNVYKHARTDQAWVTLTRKASELAIRVEDRGVGFLLPETSGGAGIGGLGVFSIRERMESLGGYMLIDTEPGKGTVVTLHIPLRN
jgi:PAS domain S-box-containing protein